MDHDTLQALARANTADKHREQHSHTALLQAIWEAAGQGMRQVDIVRATGLTRERIRQLCDPRYRERALQRITVGALAGTRITVDENAEPGTVTLVSADRDPDGKLRVSAVRAVNVSPDCPHPKARVHKGLCGNCGQHVT